MGEKVGEKLGEKVREKTGEKVGGSSGEIDRLNLCHRLLMIIVQMMTKIKIIKDEFNNNNGENSEGDNGEVDQS